MKLLKGIKLDTLTSPVINYFNTENDRKVVIGEKSLNIKDKVNFKRKTFQTITSAPYVKLEDGSYTLTAKIKNTKGFTNLEMYSLSNGKKLSYDIKEENVSWKTIIIKNIAVKEGKVEIGFQATANASCQVDDVSLVRK